MAPTALEREFPLLTDDSLTPADKKIFLEKIQSFQTIIKDKNSQERVANAKAGLNLLKRKDYVEKVGIYNLIFIQQGHQVHPKDVVSTAKKGPVDNVVSSAKLLFRINLFVLSIYNTGNRDPSLRSCQLATSTAAPIRSSRSSKTASDAQRAARLYLPAQNVEPCSKE